MTTLAEWFATHGFQRVGDHYEGWLSAKAAQELAAIAPAAEQPDATQSITLRIGADGRLVSGELARAAAAAGDERHCILTLET